MYSKQELQTRYDKFAKWYDLSEGLLELLVSPLRHQLIKKARGKILEVGVGTGRNIKYYPLSCELTATDLSQEMLNLAVKRAQKSKREITLEIMDTENLSFPDNSFDTVIETLCLCTYTNPAKALSELSRVCKPKGRILLLEHGISRYQWLAKLQDARAEVHAKALGCYWNRNPKALVNEAGIEIISENRKFLGLFYLLECRNN